MKHWTREETLQILKDHPPGPYGLPPAAEWQGKKLCLYREDFIPKMTIPLYSLPKDKTADPLLPLVMPFIKNWFRKHGGQAE